jgi:hypothetical protein
LPSILSTSGNRIPPDLLLPIFELAVHHLLAQAFFHPFKLRLLVLVGIAYLRFSEVIVDLTSFNRISEEVVHPYVRNGSTAAGRDSCDFSGLATCYSDLNGRDRPGADVSNASKAMLKAALAA